MTVNQDILDAAIRHAIYSERFGRGLARRIVALLDEVDDDLANQIEQRLARIIDGRDSGPATTRRLTAIMESLRGINDRVYRRILTTLQTELVDLAGFEIENQTATLSRIIPVTIASVSPTPAYLKTLVTTSPIDGHLLKPWVESMSANRLARIEQALRIGMVEGQTVDQLVRRIRGSRAQGYRDGILEISRRSATTLALTANSTIANRAREVVYEENSDVISKLKWVSTLDTRTSPICQFRDGQTYPLNQPHPSPPAHPRCRSIMVPITVPFEDLGLDVEEYTPSARASMDGQVPGNMTFATWLRGQPRSRIEDIFGKERTSLFLSGRIPFKEFYNSDGGFYTLAELRRRSAS